MQKIETLFIRTDKWRATPEVNPGCEWVLAGEGTPTYKWDGSACLIHDGKFYRRAEWRAGSVSPPTSWIHWTFNPEQRSGHGWLSVGEGNEDRWHREAWITSVMHPPQDGTYELVGPKVQKNPHRLSEHLLVRHGSETIKGNPRTFEEIRAWFVANVCEGIVWHHPDGRMVKIKRRDFGLPWPEMRKPG